MPASLVIESPDFELIRKQSGYAVEDAVRLLWFSMNAEIIQRSRDMRHAQDTMQGKVVVDSTTSSQNNYDIGGAVTIYFTGSSAINITGIANPIEGQVAFFHTVGSGTITFVHASASSDALNRLRLTALGNKAVATDKSIVFLYLNSLWRELSLA
jgi:hypothetical protein